MGELYYVSVSVGDVVNTVGLLFDIGGAILLFRFGLPSKWRGRDLRAVEDSDADEIERINLNRRIQTGANWGLRLLIFGFILQLIASWI